VDTTSPLLNPIFSDANKAREWLEAHLWPAGPVCGHCSAIDRATPLKLKARAGVYQCNECRKQFSVTVGTLFESSHIPLNKWLMASFLICSGKKGISAHQMHRMLDITYKSAWFMMHRIREAVNPTKFEGPLGGLDQIVEVDETFVGGKAGNRKSRRVKSKTPVVALVHRGADVRSFPIDKVNSRHINALLTKQVSKKVPLMTDDSNVYPKVGKKFRKHSTVNHSIEEFVRGEAHVNGAENYFSILKRGIIGIYHHVSDAH
jgi:transposase-like protein